MNGQFVQAINRPNDYVRKIDVAYARGHAANIGFHDVDVLSKYYNFAVYGGIKRGERLMPRDHPPVNLWGSPAHAVEYLAKADMIPHRTEGEAVLLDCLPPELSRVLDVGSGDGRLVALVKRVRPEAQCVALDFSTTMLDRLRKRFAGDPTVEVIVHDLDTPLPASLGRFDAIVSSFAIHHLADERKHTLYNELYHLLTPCGVFCNLEHVASPTRSPHERFLAELSIDPSDEDPQTSCST